VTIVGYLAPSEIEHAVAILAEHGDEVSVLSGGTMLLPELGRIGASDRIVLDIARLGLRGVTLRDGEVRLGVATPYCDLLEGGANGELAALLPILASACAGITGGAAIRRQGTIGGSACYANPSSDVPACLVSMRARLLLHGPAGVRAVPAGEFFADAFSTVCGPDELLAEIVFPHQPGIHSIGYRKFKLCESSWPIVTAAVTLQWDDAGSCVAAELTIGGATRTPQAVAIADVVCGRDPRLGLDDVAARTGEALTEPWGDVLANADYRVAVAGVIAGRALVDAAEAGPPGRSP
jgi:CO/xanthine dehydrogenase FAD-binding subunit